MIDSYVVRRVLESVIDQDARLGFMKAPFALGGDAAATDGKMVIRFEGRGEGLQATAGPDREPVLLRATDHTGFMPVGTIGLRVLADWAGPDLREVDEDGHRIIAYTKRAMMGEAVVDPCLLAKALWPLSLAGDCRVTVAVSEPLLGGGRMVLLDGDGWTIGCMGCTTDPPPGDETRPPLEPTP